MATNTTSLTDPSLGVGASAPSSPINGPSNQKIEDELAQLIALLNQLQELVAKYNNDKTNDQQKIGQGQLQQLDKAYQDALNQLKEVQEEESSSGFWGSFVKALEIIAVVVVDVVAIATGQFEIAAAATAFTLLSATGGLDKITQAISEGFQQLGLPSSVADALAKAVIVATAIVVGIATGNPTAAEGAAEEAGVEAAAEAGDEAANAAAEAGAQANAAAVEDEQVAAEEVEQADQAQQSSSGISRGRLATVAGAQAIVSTNLFGTLAADLPVDGTGREVLLSIVTVIQDLIAAFVTYKVGGLDGAVGAARAAGGAKLANIIRGLVAVEFGSQLASAGFSAAQGSVNLKLAQTTSDQSETQFALGISKSVLDLVNGGVKQTLNDEKGKAKEAEQENSLFYRLADDQAKLAEILTNA